MCAVTEEVRDRKGQQVIMSLETDNTSLEHHLLLHELQK